MSRDALDEELNTEVPALSVRDILSEYQGEFAEEEPVPPTRRSLSRASLDSLRAEEEPEESVRIYRPREDKQREQERLAARWGEEPLAREEDQEEDEPEEQAQEKTSFLSSARGLAGDLLHRFRRERSAPAREELPSFEELLWGKKDEPVRILEEEDEPETAAAPEEPPREQPPRRKPEPEPIPEVHVPKEELNGLSVDTILSDYFDGLEDDTAPVDAQPPSRRERSSRAGEKSRPSEKTRLFRWTPKAKAPEATGEKTRVFQTDFDLTDRGSPPPKPKEDAPAPRLGSVQAAEEDAANMSVADILSEFWAEYTEEEEQPAPRADAPRSRREAARMREEANPVPPTGAASSAAGVKPGNAARRQAPEKRDRKAPAPKKRPAEKKPQQRKKEPRAQDPEAEETLPERRIPLEPVKSKPSKAKAETEKSKRSSGSRGKKSKHKGRSGKGSQPRRAPVLPPDMAAETEQENVPAPPPVDPAEPAALFAFLRRGSEKPPVPAAKEAPPSPAPAAPKARRGPSPRSERPRETKHEDVEIGAMSVDEILAEYNDIFAALPAAASAIGEERLEEAAAGLAGEKAAEPAENKAPKKREAASPPSPPAPAKKAPSSGGRVSRMEEEAQDFLRQMRSESFGARREEQRPQGGLRRQRPERRPAPRPEPAPSAPAQPVYEEPVQNTAAPVEQAYEKPAENAPAPMPNVADAEWGNSLRRLLGQDPAPPQPATEPSSKDDSALRPARSSRIRAIPSDEVDPRFNLSGERKSTMVFGDKELDLSADESYVPPKASENVGFHWVAGEEELPRKPLEKQPLFRRGKKDAAPAKKADAEHTEGYDDRKKPEYAPDKDYEEADDPEDPGAFPSFGQYLSSIVSRGLVRIFGARRRQADDTGTMEDEDEDLGPEVSPAAASIYYGSFVTGLRLRVRIGVVLLVLMTWITLGLPVTGALRSVQVASGMVLAMQMTMMLLGLDVVTTAAVNLARGHFGADSLAVLCCVFTSLDALSVCLGFMGSPHMPLCLISSLSLLGVMLSSLASARGLRKALRVPAIGKRCYGVTAEAEVKGSGLTLLKSLRPPKGFVRRAEEAAPDESTFNRVAPLMAILGLLLALVVALAKHAFGEFLFILTALLCPAVPLMALLCFALPYLFGSLRIFHSGAAIAGWSGISDIGRSENLIVTDRDLFPEGSVEIDTVRIFAEVQPETVISFAGTMVCASGSDLAPSFAQLMEKNNCPMRRVEGFEFLSGGGMKGVIDGSVILCGGLDLMRLMNVRVPYRLVSKTTVLLAVDGILCGIFNMKYEGQPQVRKALVGLIRSNRHPIFAIRDFLVTPDMLSECFEVATDGYDFPPYVDRFAISEAKPSEDSKLAAVVCREGLGPLVHMADTGRSMYLAVRMNLLLTVLAAVLGVGVVFVKLLSAGTVTSLFLLLFLLVWALPVLLISLFLRL
ncbi:MAG: hypothetical protein IKF99_05360 [Oscillospiraceae bacterium]|nr:hypothetical protein [Oscillospiraceae bacterium]